MKTLVYIFSLVVTGLCSGVYSTNAQVNVTPGSFAAVILATEPANLKGYWKCDETSGTTLVDSSGNSEDLTITGAINTNYWLGETGEQGTCFRTDGVAGYASRNDAVIPGLDNTNFTLFALFKGGTDFGVAAALAISNSSTNNDRAQIGEFSTTSQASAQARGHSTVMADGFSGGRAFDGSWHAVAFRRNGTAFELFVDGTRVASTTATLATGSTCNRTTLMHKLTSGTTGYAKGSIQHAAIWNTALSDSEIMAIQTARFAAVILATEPANLKGYWKCDETSGTTLADSSGNSKDLTITGAINTNYWLGETGEQGTCFRTDGVAGYASRNDAVIPSLDDTNFTLFALFKGGTDFNVQGALAISNSSTTNDRAQIGQFSTTSQAFGRARGNSGVMANGFSGGTAFDGSWHAVAFRRNETAFDLFVDGTRVASTTATLATGSTCNRTTLMHMLTSETTAYAKGSIQHAAIWNTALSDSEIMAIQTARGRTYSTNFPVAENPISESGHWINGRLTGLDWKDVRTNVGLAYGTQGGGGAYDDSIAILSGTWGPDQMAEATVHRVNQSAPHQVEEVELRLRNTITAHWASGYEILFGESNGSNGSQYYLGIGYWRGPLNDFTRVGQPPGTILLRNDISTHDGDVVKATIIGSRITAYINNVPVAYTDDDTFTSGSPGIGFYFIRGNNTSASNSDFGFTSFTARDGITPP